MQQASNQQTTPINDPYELLTTLTQNEAVKIVDNARTIFPDVVLYDLSLEVGGPEEDDELAKNEFLRVNLRRGNTILQLLRSDGTVFKTVWARRATRKFFDLYREYIEFNLQERKDLRNFGIKNNDVHEVLHRIIFQEAKKSLWAGERVRLFSQEKLNGENAQVSWSSETESWLVASKNVSILVRHRDDIRHYENDRSSYSTQIAHTWFDILEDLEEIHINLANLKRDLTGRTLVGEFVGNSRNQHLIRYPYRTIVWFSLINMDQQSSLPIEQVLAFLDHYKLDAVRTFDLGVFTDFPSLNRTLLHRFDYTASSDMSKEGEGSVLYLQREHDGHHEIISVSKCKTLEYRILRKLREKLKRFLEEQLNRKETIKLFKKEVQELCSKNKPARHIDFYIKLADLAFDFAVAYETKARKALEQFVDFLDVLYDCIDTGKEVQPTMLLDSNLKKLQTRDRSKISPDTLNPPLKPLPLQAAPDAKAQVPTQAPKISQVEKVSSPPTQVKQKIVIAIFLIGLPGMGKSYFEIVLEELLAKTLINYEFKSVSSDVIKQTVTAQEKDRNSKLSGEKLQDAINRKSNFVYDDTIQKAIKDFSKSDSQALFLYLDKNHPPNGINKAIKTVSTDAPGNIIIKTLALYPACFKKFDRQKIYSFQFSFNFMLTCIDRVVRRQAHETLAGTEAEKLSVIFQFIAQFLGVQIRKETFDGLDHLIEFPFTVENKDHDDKFSQQLEDDFLDIVEESKDNKKCVAKGLLLDFLDGLKKFDFTNSTPDLTTFQNDITQRIIVPLMQSYDLTPIPVKTVQPQKQSQQKQQKPQVPVLEQSPLQSGNGNGVDDEVELTGEQEQKKQKRIRKGQNKSELRKKLDPYNPLYLPVYLGIFLTGPRYIYEKAINKWIKECFVFISQIYIQNLGDDKFGADPDFARMKAQWSDSTTTGTANFYELQKPLHLTTLYIGNQGETVRQLSYFKEFQPEQDHSIYLTVLIASPDNMLTALIQPPSLPVQNPYPHLTIYTGKGFKPRESNDLIAGCLSQDFECKAQATKKTTNEFAFRIKFNYRSKPTIAYVLSTGETVKLDGQSRAYDK